MSIINRDDLMSQKQFSDTYKISKSYLDKLIYEDRLNCELIAGINYISIIDADVIERAIRGKLKPGTHSRNTVIKVKKPKPGSYDARFNEAFEQFEKENS